MHDFNIKLCLKEIKVIHKIIKTKILLKRESPNILVVRIPWMSYLSCFCFFSVLVKNTIKKFEKPHFAELSLLQKQSYQRNDNKDFNYLCDCVLVLKVHIFREFSFKILPISLDVTISCQIKAGYFFKILWPSQNVWTLLIIKGDCMTNKCKYDE